jgi:hypothetical protein
VTDEPSAQASTIRARSASACGVLRRLASASRALRSRTIVFDAPRQCPQLFEALVAGNLDIGRPHNVEIIFARKIRRDTREPPHRYRARDNGGVLVNIYYKHSRIKQYLRAGRCGSRPPAAPPATWAATPACPTWTNCRPRPAPPAGAYWMSNVPARAPSLRAQPLSGVAHPFVDTEGRRTPARRFGDPRVMALAGALCRTLLAATGFTSKNLRVLIAGLLGSPYAPGQMTYDLRRLRLNGLIRRLPHTNRYTLTGDGIRLAVFYTRSTTGSSSPSPPRTRPTPRPNSHRAINHHPPRRRLRQPRAFPAPRET